MMELAMQILNAAGFGELTLEQKADRDLEALAVDGVVPVVFKGAMTTYDVEVWLFDHGKKGVAKIIKRIPRHGSEEECKKNRARIQDALYGMYQEKLRAASVV